MLISDWSSDVCSSVLAIACSYRFVLYRREIGSGPGLANPLLVGARPDLGGALGVVEGVSFRLCRLGLGRFGFLGRIFPTLVEQILHPQIQRLAIEQDALAANLFQNPAVGLGGEIGDFSILGIVGRRGLCGSVHRLVLSPGRND